MTQTNWRWTIVAFLAIQVVLWSAQLFAPHQDAFGKWGAIAGIAVFVAVAAIAWLRGGKAGLLGRLDQQAAPAPAFSEQRGSYLALLALWIVAGIGFAYYIAFVKH
jgi:hypothetical protein